MAMLSADILLHLEAALDNIKETFYYSNVIQVFVIKT